MNFSIIAHSFVRHLPNIVSAIIILVIGLGLVYGLKKVCLYWLDQDTHPTLKSFIVNFIRVLLLILVLIITLAKLGVPTASLIAVLGASSLAVGLALKDFLSNVAAGLMLFFLRPFKIGDYVDIAGDAGTIIDISLFMVHLKTATNEGLFIPNNRIMTNRIVNKTYYDTRRLDICIGIGYQADMTMAKQIALQVAKANTKVLMEPEPMVAIQDLADSTVQLLLRVWTNRADLITTQFELTEAIKVQFDAADISIAYPQLDVHLHQ